MKTYPVGFVFTALFHGTEMREGKFENSDTSQVLRQHISHEQCLGKTIFAFVPQGSVKTWKVQVKGLQMCDLFAQSSHFFWVVGRFKIEIAAHAGFDGSSDVQIGQARSSDRGGSGPPWWTFFQLEGKDANCWGEGVVHVGNLLTLIHDAYQIRAGIDKLFPEPVRSLGAARTVSSR